VAAASIRLLLSRDWRGEVRAIEAALRAGLAPARALPGVADVRVLGAIGVVQLDHAVDVAAASAASTERGVWLRPFRDLVYTMPPYVCTPDDLAAITAGVCAAAAAG
jgi:adenosylmethionine-8-amino-7-oxononanoate aminotransferase